MDVAGALSAGGRVGGRSAFHLFSPAALEHELVAWRVWVCDGERWYGGVLFIGGGSLAFHVCGMRCEFAV